MQQQRDEGAIDCTALALSADSSYLATGGSSGVVNVYRRPAGLLSPVNFDDADVASAGATSSPAAAGGFRVQPVTPAPLKAIMNLTTSIDSLSFSHDSQMLLMGSRLKKDSLRIVHLPSLTVFANWPTSRSPLQYVHSAAFSPHSGFLGIGNAKGRALLYRLHHYPEA
jgi:U3 small nucleolar RNA-associated protein 18